MRVRAAHLVGADVQTVHSKEALFRVPLGGVVEKLSLGGKGLQVEQLAGQITLNRRRTELRFSRKTEPCASSVTTGLL